jgi:hypothetical protein
MKYESTIIYFDKSCPLVFELETSDSHTMLASLHHTLKLKLMRQDEHISLIVQYSPSHVDPAIYFNNSNPRSLTLIPCYLLCTDQLHPKA